MHAMCFKESAICNLFIKQTVLRAKQTRSLLLKYRHAQMLQMWQHACRCVSANGEELNSGDDNSGAIIVMARTLGERRMGLVFTGRTGRAWQTARKVGFAIWICHSTSELRYSLKSNWDTGMRTPH